MWSRGRESDCHPKLLSSSPSNISFSAFISIVHMSVIPYLIFSSLLPNIPGLYALSIETWHTFFCLLYTWPLPPLFSVDFFTYTWNHTELIVNCSLEAKVIAVFGTVTLYGSWKGFPSVLSPFLKVSLTLGAGNLKFCLYFNLIIFFFKNSWLTLILPQSAFNSGN